MNHAILLHGRPDKEEYFDDTIPKPHEAHWFPWIKEQLEKRGISVDIPEMPRPYQPDYEEWEKVFETYTLNPETILVGHSRDGGFLLRYLSENKIQVAKFIMVAPSIIPNSGVVTGFSEYVIDKTLTQRIPNIAVFYSTDDEKGILESVQKIKQNLPDSSYYEFSDKGHFTEEDLGTKIFPELLEEILK